MHQSIWKETKLASFPRLTENKKTDVLIIGGGLCGVLCAYYLKQAGVDCLLVEGDRIGSGVSGNTTGKVTWLQGLVYSDLIQKYGREKAQMYLRSQQEALREYEKLSDAYDFDFEKRSAYTYSLKSKEGVEREGIALRALGAEVHLSAAEELPFKTQGTLCAAEQGQLNIIKLLRHLTRDITVFEHTFVKNITAEGVYFHHGVICAKNIIVATHFPFVDRWGGYFLKQYQHRSYVLALKNAPRIKGMYVDEADKGMSFRSYGDTLLLGGGGHRTGKRGGGFEEVENFVRSYYPKAKVVTCWATQDCMTLDRLPYIGQYSSKTPNIFVATGFNKWGLTNSMAAALLLRDSILGKKKDWDLVFSPRRSVLHPQFFINLGETAGNMILPLPKRCSHLGCALHYNKAEHSWDCPCHGSRFSENGKVLDNPADRPANVKSHFH